MPVPHPDDTIVAISSAAGVGERGIVRWAGERTRTLLEQIFVPENPERPPRPRWVSRGWVQLEDGLRIPAVAYLFLAPHSYTGQDVAELHTLGSPPLLEALLTALLRLGARSAQPGEFTLRAFLAGKKDLAQAEAVLALIEAGNDEDLVAAMKQLAGGMSQPLSLLRDDLLNLLADVEAALDFVDENIEFVSATHTLQRIAAALAQLTHLRRQLESRGLSGRDVRVVLLGAPNAGKSSLFNALCGAEEALVSPEAGTTRDYLRRSLVWDGHRLELIDTAGEQVAATVIESQAQDRRREQAAAADFRLVCIPVIEPRGHAVSSDWVIRTKSDLLPGFTPGPGEWACSAKSGQGLSELRRAIIARLEERQRSALAPSLSRCRSHLEAAVARLQEAHRHGLFGDPPELLALALRSALDELGAMTGAIYTNDLLDRIFSRFCIGK